MDESIVLEDSNYGTSLIIEEDGWCTNCRDDYYNGGNYFTFTQIVGGE